MEVHVSRALHVVTSVTTGHSVCYLEEYCSGTYW